MTFAMFQRTTSIVPDEVVPTLSEWNDPDYTGYTSITGIARNTFIKKLRLEGTLSNATITGRLRTITDLPFAQVINWIDSRVNFVGVFERELFHGMYDREAALMPSSETTGWTIENVHRYGIIQRFRVKLSFYGAPRDYDALESNPSTATGTAFGNVYSGNAFGDVFSFKRHHEWIGEFVSKDHSASYDRTLHGLTWTPLLNDSRKVWPVYETGTEYRVHASLTSDFVFGSDYNPNLPLSFDNGHFINTRVYSPSYSPRGIVTITGRASVSGTPKIQSSSVVSNSYKTVKWTAPFQVEAGKWFKIIIDNTSPVVTLLTGINADLNNGPVQP